MLRRLIRSTANPSTTPFPIVFFLQNSFGRSHSPRGRAEDAAGGAIICGQRHKGRGSRSATDFSQGADQGLVGDLDDALIGLIHFEDQEDLPSQPVTAHKKMIV
jgi:hypothetical protein